MFDVVDVVFVFVLRDRVRGVRARRRRFMWRWGGGSGSVDVEEKKVGRERYRISKKEFPRTTTINLMAFVVWSI